MPVGKNKKVGGRGLAPQPRSPIRGAVDLGCILPTVHKLSSHHSSTWSSLPQPILCQQGPPRGHRGWEAWAGAGKPGPGLVWTMSRQFLATSAPAISSLQVAFRLDFEFSKSVFLHHLEIQLTAGRSGPCPLPLPPCLLLLALLCCWEHPPPHQVHPLLPQPGRALGQHPGAGQPAALPPIFILRQLGYKRYYPYLSVAFYIAVI